MAKSMLNLLMETIGVLAEQHLIKIRKLKKIIEEYEKLQKMTTSLQLMELNGSTAKWDDVFKNEDRFKKYSPAPHPRRIKTEIVNC